ncbi:MAG: c-type cytochrome [Vicinamibacterales bacterium]|jgi:cytochrome c2|nr:c-type cytochrome [Vicinamibacterales bacterium]
MADKRAVGHAYNIDFLNVVFAASSLFVLFTTVWMIWDDYDREWKNYQRQFTQLEMEVTRAGLAAAQGDVDQARVAELTSQRAAAEQELASSAAQRDELEAQLAEVERELFVATQNFQFTKANYDVDRYAFESRREEIHAEDPEAEVPGEAEVTALYEEWLAQGLEVESQTATRDGLRAQLAAISEGVAVIDDELTSLTGETERLQGLISDLEPSLIDDYLLNAPLVDFLAPSLKVRQTITPNVVDDVNFIRVPKMDRCETCHLAIDREGYEEYPQPFRTHPNLDVYVGNSSPHSIETTGCTVCHEGMGQSITFVDAAHSPATDEQMAQWEVDYHWEESHLWDYPMLPTGMTEASCAKCHKGEVFVPEADNLNLAYGMYERAGCYSCHKTAGFEDLRKPGPDLVKVASKLDREWVSDWLRDPRAVKPSTWMPRVWYNSNTDSPEDAVRNEVEIDAVVAYLYANSEEHELAVSNPRRGDAENGQQIVEAVGCLACHVTGGETRQAAGPRRTFGQPLQAIGSKTTFEWLFDWVRNPRHYSAEAYMPDMRLTDGEVSDVAEYLVGLTGGTGVGAQATYQATDVDAVLLDYIRAIVPYEEAQAEVAGMSPEERQLDLGRRAIGRYGCYSCHEIDGFDDIQPIGTELSAEGSKLLPQFDFAFVHDIPHTKRDWIGQKLLDPRIYDRNRILQPLEKLRMPDFGFSEEEARLLTTAVMSFQRDVQPKVAQVARSARKDATINGRNLFRRRNCVACHEMEGDGGDYRDLVEEAHLAPPLLTPEGAKVKPDWLYAFLRGPITIRPWLDVRMPSFGLDDADWNEAIDYFAAVSDAVGPFRTHEVDPDPGDLRTGEELFELLRCQQCHVLDTIPEGQDVATLAPDLRMSPERLQADWVLEWMIRPLDIQPGTNMPNFWTEYPGSFYPQFEQDGVAQIRSIRDYLWTFSGGPSPVRGN